MFFTSMVSFAFFFKGKLIRDIATSMNMTVVVNQPSDGGWWGADEGNRTFNGLIGDLQFKRADVGWAGFFVYPERTGIIDYTVPVITDKVCFMVRS